VQGRADGPADAATGFAAAVAALLFGGPLDATLAVEPEVEHEILDRARRVAARAYPAERVSDRSTDRWVDHAARDQLHRGLLACYQMHVRLPHHGMAENQFHPVAMRLMSVLEGAWERDLLARARRSAHRAVGDALTEAALPADPDAFAEWFKRAAFTHPLYEHPLYAYLAGEATREQLERFLRLEAAGEAAFDDLVALGQVGTRGEVKIEMGRNYWDELGNGKSHAVHTHLFHRLTDALGIEAPEADELPWQVLNGVNVMLWSCIPRRNAFRAQGTLGAVELLAPQRCTRLTTAAERVGIPKKAMIYYAAHAIVDIGHAEGWLDHVLKPQIAQVPAARVGIAEGLMARADASLDYFDYALGLLRGG
jgi:pyrroloquinoline quinone (PQQ) biosynthesis protein C